MAETVFQRVVHLLNQHQVPHQVSEHEAVFTSEQAAQVRGTSLASGAKALVCKADDQFCLFVLPADRRLDSKRVRRALSIRSLRFASAQEVEQLTGLQPGSIPPFGSLFQLPTYCDQRLAEQPQINFNAGDHCISVSMTLADYLRAEQPAMAELT